MDPVCYKHIPSEGESGIAIGKGIEESADQNGDVFVWKRIFEYLLCN